MITSPDNLDFDGSMSRNVLETYLSRAQTMVGMLQGHGYFEDNLRMMINTGTSNVEH